jgi:hypothetical protein
MFDFRRISCISKAVNNAHITIITITIFQFFLCDISTYKINQIIAATDNIANNTKTKVSQPPVKSPLYAS